jgi:hypothetical protein
MCKFLLMAVLAMGCAAEVQPETKPENEPFHSNVDPGAMAPIQTSTPCPPPMIFMVVENGKVDARIVYLPCAPSKEALPEWRKRMISDKPENDGQEIPSSSPNPFHVPQPGPR